MNIEKNRVLLERLKEGGIWDGPTFASLEEALEDGLDIEPILSLECPAQAAADACLALGLGQVWGDEGLRLEKVAMAARDQEGAPTIFTTYVVVSADEYNLGGHYDKAINTAIDLGYEAGNHTICFDATEQHSIISAGRHMSDETIYVAWNIDDIHSRLKDTESGYKVTDKQACEILAQIDRGHDAEVGITWETISYHTEMYIKDNGIEPMAESCDMNP